MGLFNKVVQLGAVASLVLTVSANASVRVIDFDEGLTGGHIRDAQIIDTEYLSSEFGVRVNSCNFRGSATSHQIRNANCGAHDITNRAVAFNTNNNNSADNDLEFDNRHNDYRTQYTPVNVGGVTGSGRPNNILIINEDHVHCNASRCNQANDEASRPSGFVEFVFTDLVDILSIDFFDFEEGGDRDASRISFYEGNNEKTFGFVPDTGDGEFQRVTFNASGINRLVVRYPGSGGIDNIVFRHGDGGTTPVNAPASVAILLVGGLIAMRRKMLG